MLKTSDDSVLVCAVGDVFVDIEDGASSFRHVRRFLADADIVIGNNEGVYSDNPATPPTARHVATAPRSRAHSLKTVPFHVLTCANNHIMDGGYQGLDDTLDTLAGQGIATAGAGSDIASALRPAMIERKSIRVAFLAVASVFPVGYEARSNRPGLAPIRVRTFYSIPDSTFWEPEVPPLVTSVPDQDDLNRLQQAIAAAREAADIIVVSCHWGNSSLYGVVQDYEIALARRIAEMGADAVLCHHHHSLRGMEFHQGSPIFYGLGAFVHHLPRLNAPLATWSAYGDFAHGPRKDFPLFPFHEDARMSCVATLLIEKGAFVSAGLLPAMVRPDGSIELCLAGSREAEMVTDYFRMLTTKLGCETAIEVLTHREWAYLKLTGPDQASLSQ